MDAAERSRTATLFTRSLDYLGASLKRLLRLLSTINEATPDRRVNVTRCALNLDPNVSVEIVSAALACCTMQLQAALNNGASTRVTEVGTGLPSGKRHGPIRGSGLKH